MRHRMMSNTWKVACFLFIFYKIIETQASVDTTFLTVTEGVRKFYLSPSTFIVFDRRSIDFTKEKTLLDIIKSYSSRDVMSQAITFDHLKLLSDRNENTLYSMLIHDRENLEHAINATKNTDMSNHPWFLYIRKSTKFDCSRPVKNFFKLRMHSWMSAMCAGDATLKSYHGIYDGQTEVADLAVWSPEKMRLEFKNERRLTKSHMDLKGITLRLAAKVNRSMLIDNMYVNIAKFNYEIIDEIANLSNFKTEVVAIQSGSGYFNSRKNEWFGMMKIMNDKLVDIGLALVTVSRTRMKVVDYAIPLAKGRRNLYAKLPDDTDVTWSSYFKVYNEKSWAAIGVSILIFSILICLIKNGLRRISTRLFFEDVIKTWGIFCLQSPNDTSPSISIRIGYFSIFFISLILNAIYSGSITSYIAVLSPNLPFSSYDEFLRDNNYDLVVVKGSREHGLVLSDHTYWTPLQRKLKESHLWPKYAYEGFRQACQHKTAYVTNEVIYNANQNYLTCKLGTVYLEKVDYMSFVTTKNNPCLSVINFNILRLMNYGLLDRLKEKYFKKYNELYNPKPNVITLKEIWSIIIIWAVGLTIAVTGLLIEIIVFRFSSVRRAEKTSIHHRMIVNKQRWSEKNMKLRNNKMLRR